MLPSSGCELVHLLIQYYQRESETLCMPLVPFNSIFAKEWFVALLC